MALGADSLPGWHNKPTRDSRNSEQESARDDTENATERAAERASDSNTTGGTDETSPHSSPASESAAQTASTTTGGGSENEPVVVWQAHNRLEAQVVKGRLESEGVPAFLSGEALGTIYGLTTGNLAATSVLVPGPLAEKAHEILNSEVVWDDAVWDMEDPDGEFQTDGSSLDHTDTEWEDGEGNRPDR